MNLSKKLTFIVLSAVYANAVYTSKPTVIAQYSVHPIAQKCNKNAAKIKNFMKKQGIVPLNFSNTAHNNVELQSEEQHQLKIIVLPIWLILEKTENGSLNSIIIFE